MDFRNCPDCKASVLEEDVDECPFCGASMSGKPKPSAAKKPAPPASGGKPAAPSAGQKKSNPAAPAGPGKPVAGKPAGPGASPAGKPAGKAASPESDDPFDVDTSALRRAVKLAPKVMKGRTLEVVCPMCETPGFMLPTDAGKDVHCCNPDCMVPVFKTKKPKVEEAPKVESSNKTMIFGGAGALIAVIVGVVFFLLPKKPEEAPVAPITDKAETLQKEDLVKKNIVLSQKEKPLATLPEIQRISLEQIPVRAKQRDRNRHPEFGFQLAAEAYAQAGELANAQEQIKRLQAAGAGVAYLQIEPLVELGWRQLKSGKQPAALEAAKDALSKAKRLPKTIRKTHDAVISLGALLVALGEESEANALVEQEQDFGVRGVLSVCWRSAMDSRTFNVNDESRFVWHLNIPTPMRMGIVESLVARGQSEAALKFAATGTDAASHSSCRAAWAGRLAILQPANAAEQVIAAIEAGQFDLASQAQIWAAVADSANYRKDSAAAKSALDKAIAAFEQLPAPAPLKFPGMKAVYDGDGKANAGLPDPMPAKSTALAATGIALVQLHQGDKQASLQTLRRALDAYQAMTPSPVLTKARLEACMKQEPSVRAALARSLGLPNTEERIRIPFARYRKQCGILNDIAQHRLTLQSNLLRTMALEGLTEEVWELINERSSTSDEQLREPFLTDTKLPGLIQSLAENRGLTDLLTAVKAKFQDKPLTVDPLDQIEALTWQQLSAGKPGAAGTVLEKAFRSALAKRVPFHLDLIAFQIGGDVQTNRSTEDSINFIQGLFDPLIQEDLFTLLAGNSVNRGTAPQLWKTIEGSRDLDALEFAALYRGFVSGITGLAAKAPPASSETPK